MNRDCYRIFHTKWARKANNSSREDTSNPNQEVSGQSRGVYFFLVQAEKLLS
jgi:hypothetical protein